MMSRPRALKSALLFTLIFISYLPALRCGYIWDDDFYVETNPTFGSLEGLKTIWYPFDKEKVYPITVQYYPLVYTSFWLEHAVWGLEPMGYHLVNILLHIACAFLLWRILIKLKIPGAWFAALLFGLHPVHVESVAWITERKNVLSGLFYLGSLYAFWKWRFQERRLSLYLISLVLFLGALLSKTVTCTLPFVILVLLWMKGKKIFFKEVPSLIPFFVVGGLLGILTVFNEVHMAGAQGKDWDFTLTDRFLIAGRALMFYLGKLVWPSPLIFIYPRWEIDMDALWQYTFPIAVIFLFAGCYLLQNKIGRKPFVACFYFFITLFPALGFFNVYPMKFSFVADHFQYLASIGPLALIAALFAKVRANLTESFRPFFYLTCCFIVPIFGSLIWKQCQDYENDEILWIRTIQKNPKAWMALNNLGASLNRENNHNQAIALFERTIELYPENHTAYFNLGYAYQRGGDFDRAVENYYIALKYDPAYTEVHPKLGYVLQLQGREEEALTIYRAGLKYEPDNFSTHNNLGILYSSQSNYEKSLEHFQKALAIDPEQAEGLRVKGKIELLKKHLGSAVLSAE